MADKDFQVKNGLVVNSNNYGGANRLTVNATSIYFGNTTSNITINSSAFSAGALVFNASFKPATATLADNTAFVGTVSAANVVSNAQLQANLANYLTTSSATSTYQTMAGLTANVATRTANNATFAYGKTEINLNVNNSLTANLSTFSGTAAAVGNNGSATGASFNFIYTPQVGSPTYVWGTTDGTNYRPYSITQITSLGVGTSASGTTGEIRATNNITAYFSSDERLKTNIETLTNALEKVKNIRGVSFDWKDEYIHDHGGEDGYFIRKRDVGVIAQDIEKVLPEVVVDRIDGTKAVKYDRIIALLIEAVKELSEKIES
jgi:hypothetical protein